VERHKTGQRGRLRDAIRAGAWSLVGKATAFLALGNWPEPVLDAIHAVHEHAYFKWSSSARANRPARCVRCTAVMQQDALGWHLERFPMLVFCSEKCRALFVADVERQRQHPPDVRPS
jgi:hypothetical protein